MEPSKQERAVHAISERQRQNQVRRKLENRSMAKVYGLMVVAIVITVAVAMWLAGLRHRGVI
jgi:FtsH-binding integral membrane protein